VNGWSRLIFIALGALALVFGLTEPTTKSTLDPALKEIADLRPDAFMEGVYQRQFDAAGQLETTLVATSLLDFGDRANAELVEGVEDLQILLGIDTDSDGVPNQYLDPNAAVNTGQIVAILLEITANSISDAGSTEADGLLRRTFRQTIKIRNPG